MSEFQKLIKKIDLVHAKIVRSRGSCILCGARPVVCCHIFSRNHYLTRYDTRVGGNCIPACVRCHGRDHAGEGIFEAWYRKNFGSTAWDELKRRANTKADYTICQLKEMLAAMRERLR